MTAFFALVRKDLVLRFANRRAVLMSIAAPILIAAFFGSLFGGRASGPTRVPVAVTDLDRSDLSRGVVAALRADATLRIVEAGEGDPQAQVRAGSLRAALTLPAGFGAQAGAALVGAAAAPEVTLVFDPSQAMTLPLVRGVLAQHVMQQLGRQALGPGRPPGPPFTTREVEAAATGPNAPYDGYAHSFAGMGVQFILLMGVDMAIGLLTMRRLGLWQRLRAAPLSRRVLLGSRMASCALIALIVFGVIYAVAMAAFGVRVHGSVLGFAAVLVAFALLTASFGLLIAAVGRTPEVTRGLAILATLLLVMLGGAWVPSFIFPEWLQTASLAAPTRWAVDGLDAMTWRGLPLPPPLAPVGAMLAFSALFLAIAVARFDWQE